MSDDELRRSAVLRAAEGFKRAESSQFVADLKRTVRSPAVASLSEMQVAAERWRKQLPRATKEMLQKLVDRKKPTLRVENSGPARKRGRKPNSGWAKADETLLLEMKDMIEGGRAPSPDYAAGQVAARAAGGGILKSRATRLAKAYRKRFVSENNSPD